MPALLVAALVVVPLVELYVLIQVGQVIGAGWTIAVLVLVSLLGAALLRREGARTWHAFRASVTGGRVPGREVADGALVIFGGALLLTPGFATDAVGLLCVLPPTRALLRKVLLRTVTRRLLGGTPPGTSSRGPSGLRRPGPGRVVDGEVVDGDPPQA